MNFNNHLIVSLLAVTIFSSTILFNDISYDQIYNFNKENIISSNFIQNAYAAKEEGAEDNDQKKDFNNKEDNSIFNIAAVGDFDCNDDAEDTVDNIIDQDPELVLALGDFSYNGDAECWLDMIGPIADKTKIVIGKHKDDSVGNVYVVNTRNVRVQKFDSNGNFITMWGLLGCKDDHFLIPHDIAMDSEGYIYVTDSCKSHFRADYDCNLYN